MYMWCWWKKLGVCCRALGFLAAELSCSDKLSASSEVVSQNTAVSPALSMLSEGLKQMLCRSSVTQRMVATLTISHWGHAPSDLLSLLCHTLTDQPNYHEMTPFLVNLQRDCHVRLLRITGAYSTSHY